MKAQFEVIEINDDRMKLKTQSGDACTSCSASGACGTSVLSKYFGSLSIIEKPLAPNTKIGDQLMLEISSRELFWRAFQLYMLPILMLFVGAYIAKDVFLMNELGQIISGFLAFSSTILLLKYAIK